MAIIRIFLTLFFGWWFLKQASLFFRTTSLDRVLFESLGIGWLFWGLLSASAIGSLAVLGYLWLPTVVPFWLALLGILLQLSLSTVGAALGMARPDILKQAFIASREERGLPVRDSVLAMMDNPFARLLPLILALLVTGVGIALLYLVYRDNNATNRQALQSHRPATADDRSP